MRKTLLVFSILSALITSTSYTQSVTPAILNSSGGTIFFTFYRFEWSFGEAIAINTMADASNLVVTNGLLQPHTHDPAKVDNTKDWAEDEIRILPNPTKNLLEVDFFSKQKGKVSMSLFSATGQLLASRQFDYYGMGRIEHWQFERYSSGQYFIKIKLVANAGSVSKDGSYKIVKIK